MSAVLEKVRTQGNEARYGAIRIDDVVIVENEWGVIEEITGTYVIVRIWDQRRLVVPLQYWIEKPFQNWTRTTSELIGTVFLWVDYRMPLAPLREALQRACESSVHWDQRLALLQVTEAGERAMQLRCLVTAASAPAAWDLRCHVREQLVDFMQREYPQCLPRQRQRPGTAHPRRGGQWWRFRPWLSFGAVSVDQSSVFRRPSNSA